MAQTPAGLWAGRAGRVDFGVSLLEAVPSPGPGRSARGGPGPGAVRRPAAPRSGRG